MRQDSESVTLLVAQLANGDKSIIHRLVPLIYKDLLRVARNRLGRESSVRTLDPTDLVHEAYLRLSQQENLKAENRSHFYAIAANTMRRILIEHARKRLASKRDAGIRVTFHPDLTSIAAGSPDVLALDEILQKLEALDQRKSRVIELKFFGGLTSEEIGQVEGISTATVGRELRLGQAWLRREMQVKA